MGFEVDRVQLERVRPAGGVRQAVPAQGRGTVADLNAEARPSGWRIGQGVVKLLSFRRVVVRVEVVPLVDGVGELCLEQSPKRGVVNASGIDLGQVRARR
jgi:hypothetical protein